ncbi:hypothetical protein [Paenibacillus sp. MMO-177]|uniref:hypothetical protein n=1 Tax=Paenibacillus sp. MMO-177 TaxID=3081289 RepID=UPI003019A17C
MIRRNDEIRTYFGKAVVYGDPNYTYHGESKEWIRDLSAEKANHCEILDITEVQKDRIITSKYVLPIADATISTSSDGLVYSFHCSLPYLHETAHLADVEINTIMEQAFAYTGRTQPPPKTPLMLVGLVGLLGLLALVGMFK